LKRNAIAYTYNMDLSKSASSNTPLVLHIRIVASDVFLVESGFALHITIDIIAFHIGPGKSDIRVCGIARDLDGIVARIILSFQKGAVWPGASDLRTVFAVPH
jgi:hypothetical protein